MTLKKSIDLHYLYPVLAIIISFLGFNYGVFALISFLFVPAVISVMMYRYSIWDGLYTILAIVIFTLLNTCLYNQQAIIMSFAYSLFIAVSGIMLGICFVKKFSFKRALIVLTGFYTVCSAVVFAALKYIFDINITEIFRAFFVEAYSLFFETLQMYNPQLSSAISIPEYDLFNIFYSVMPGLVPYFTIAVSIFTSLVQYTISKSTLTSALIDNSDFFDGFEKFKLSVVSAVFFLLTFLLNTSGIDNMLSMINLNVFLSIATLYIIEAISLIYFSLKKSVISRALRILMVVGIVIFSFVISSLFPIINIVYLFIFVGLSDSIFNYRKLGDNQNEKDK